jgi:hypothetical protein
MKAHHIQDASRFLFVYSNEVIDIMKSVRDANCDPSKMTAADVTKIEQSIKQLALAQSALRKVRDIATTSIAR